MEQNRAIALLYQNIGAEQGYCGMRQVYCNRLSAKSQYRRKKRHDRFPPKKFILVIEYSLKTVRRSIRTVSRIHSHQTDNTFPAGKNTFPRQTGKRTSAAKNTFSRWKHKRTGRFPQWKHSGQERFPGGNTSGQEGFHGGNTADREEFF